MMRYSARHLLSAIVLTVFLLGGCATQPKSAPMYVPSDAFMQLMSREGPKRLCVPDHSPFRRCFNLSVEQCMSVVNRVMPACIRQIQAEMPPSIISQEQSKRYGEMLGRCVGYRFLASDPAFLEQMQRCKVDSP